MKIYQWEGDDIGIDEKTQRTFRVYATVTYDLPQQHGMKQWCEINCMGQYDFTSKSFGFALYDDALMFYMTFQSA